MQPGQISDLVKTEYGYHIIKLTDKKPGGTKKLDEVRQQITDSLAFDRAQTQATTLAESLEGQIKKPADLDTVAKAQGLTVQETGLFARDEPILGVGSAPEMTARAFSMNPGEVSGMLRTSRGFAFETVTDKKDSYVPKIDEVKDKVRDEVVKQRAREMAKTQAQALAEKLKGAPDFDKAAKAANADVKTTELLTRDSPLPELGSAPDVLEAAFKLPEGAISDPVSTENGTAIFKVVEKQESSPQDLTANKEAFRAEIVNDRKNRFFSAYMQKAKQKMKISVNREALKRVVG
jgi:peptidyl-prolyl cis-trans isomerase D